MSQTQTTLPVHIIPQMDDAGQQYTVNVTLGEVEAMAITDPNGALLYLGFKHSQYVSILARAYRLLKVTERAKSAAFNELCDEWRAELTETNGKAPTKAIVEEGVRSHPDYLKVCRTLIEAEVGVKTMDRALESLVETRHAIQTRSANMRPGYEHDAAANRQAAQTHDYTQGGAA